MNIDYVPIKTFNNGSCVVNVVDDAHVLNQRRRAALEEVDNAKFSLVLSQDISVRPPDQRFLQMVPHKGCCCRRRWILHRRVRHLLRTTVVLINRALSCRYDTFVVRHPCEL